MSDEREGFAAFMLRLRGRGLASRELIDAFEATPRASFLPGQFHTMAWSERMLPIECGEAIEGADLQATVIGGLDIQPGNRILEVGTGTGFTAAVMARLAGRVISLDRYRMLADQARERLQALNISNAVIRQADGSSGLAGEGPFDRIVAWVAFDSLPRFFVDQLSSGGTLIVPIGPDEGVQTIARLTKVGSRFERADLGQARLLPAVKGLAAKL